MIKQTDILSKSIEKTYPVVIIIVSGREAQFTAFRFMFIRNEVSVKFCRECKNKC